LYSVVLILRGPTYLHTKRRFWETLSFWPNTFCAEATPSHWLNRPSTGHPDKTLLSSAPPGGPRTMRNIHFFSLSQPTTPHSQTRGIFWKPTRKSWPITGPHFHFMKPQSPWDMGAPLTLSSLWYTDYALCLPWASTSRTIRPGSQATFSSVSPIYFLPISTSLSQSQPRLWWAFSMSFRYSATSSEITRTPSPFHT
jgi:hypothetical protein